MSRHNKREKSSLPVDLRRSKTSLLKLPIVSVTKPLETDPRPPLQERLGGSPAYSEITKYSSMSCRLSVQTLKDCDIRRSIFSNCVFNNNKSREAVVFCYASNVVSSHQLCFLNLWYKMSESLT